MIEFLFLEIMAHLKLDVAEIIIVEMENSHVYDFPGIIHELVSPFDCYIIIPALLNSFKKSVKFVSCFFIIYLIKMRFYLFETR